MLLALSAYTADTLSLDYSAAGFYLTALLLVVPVATYALRPFPSVPSGASSVVPFSPAASLR